MTTAGSERPTTSVAHVVLDSMDDMVARLLNRLDGIEQPEYLWEPVPAMWSVAETPDGVRTTHPDGEVSPAPVTTIAWRLWHLASSCFADYTNRFSGAEYQGVNTAWTMNPAEAVQLFETNWALFRAELVSFDDWFSELGDNFGPWHRHCVADFAMHASNELVHHGAEIALLRDNMTWYSAVARLSTEPARIAGPRTWRFQPGSSPRSAMSRVLASER